MTDNEKLDLILSELHELRADLQKTNSDVQELKTEVQVLKTEVHELKTEVQVLKTDVQGLKTDVQVLKTDVQVLKTDVQEMKADIKVIFRRLNRLEVGQAETKRVLYRLERQIFDTYNLALDSWGQGVENRVWFTEGVTANA